MPVVNGVLEARLKLNGDTAANLAADNPTLLDREACYETDTYATDAAGVRRYKFKLGPGAWNSLPYALLGPIDAATLADITSAISAHAVAADPHGDRAYTDSKVAQEVTDRNAAIAAALVGLWDDRGNFDASGADAYPTTGGSGTGGAILKGDVWTVSAAGHGLDLGDTVRALVDSPGLTASNWAAGEANVQQATESQRGTAKVVGQPTIEDSATTNDIDIVTPKKWWQGWAKGLTLTGFFSAVRGVLLAGLSPSDAVVADTDSMLVAAGKLQGQLSAFRSKVVINAQTGTSYTVAAADAGADRMLTQSNAAAITTTLPANATTAIAVGSFVSGMQLDAGKVTIAGAGGVTLINPSNAFTTVGNGSTWCAMKVATDTWVVFGTLTP